MSLLLCFSIKSARTHVFTFFLAFLVVCRISHEHLFSLKEIEEEKEEEEELVKFLIDYLELLS